MRTEREVTGSPVLLLDVDGVVNAVPWGRKQIDSGWPPDSWRSAKVRGFTITVSSGLVAWLWEVHESGRVEVRWHTTWGARAQLIAAEFGLPEWPVQDAPEYKLWASAARGWWKFPAARRVLSDEKRPLIWVDDDLFGARHRAQRRELRDLGEVLLICPDERTGLARLATETITEWLDERAQADASDAMTVKG